MEYYSTLKKNEIIAFANKWIELENIMLSDISQSQKTKGQIFSPIFRLKYLCEFNLNASEPLFLWLLGIYECSPFQDLEFLVGG